MTRNLYLFTGQFPYAQYVECFLEDEVKYLSQRFDRIIVVPIRGSSIKRYLPDNCISTEPILQSKLKFFYHGIYNKRTAPVFREDFFRNKVYLSRKKFFVWIKGLLVINNLLNSKIIQKIESSISDNDVCYYYWGKWSNLLTLFLKSKSHHISRFHGAWDLWEEDFEGYTPLRKELSQKLDKAVFISRKGEEYYKKKYLVSNTLYSPLGSSDFGVCKKSRDTSQVSIVSCSTIYPLKRVDLIFESVLLFAKTNNNMQVYWTHMGGGVDFEKINNLAAQNKQPNLSVNLTGNLSHDKVIEIFQDKKYDVFINLSVNEGVPVSIMEAISFDIPVVATAVGGTPEIVTSESGKLVSPCPTSHEVANAISDVLAANYKPREFWNTHFCAMTNYSRFADDLVNLTK